MRIDTQMRTLNDPKQVAKFQEALKKSREENNLKKIADEKLAKWNPIANKLQIDLKERQNMSETKVSDIKDNDETTFPAFYPAKALGEKATFSKEYYEKQNKINKMFDNPREHIRKKYYDRKYPYYVKGLTNLEREIVYENEINVLNGFNPSPNYYDPIIQEKFGGKNNVLVEDMEYNQSVRNQIRDSINQLFEENNIVISDDANLQLVVDPYDYKIYALGVEDEIADKIEIVLNKGNNGKNLYSHIEHCNPANFNFVESFGLHFSEPEQYGSGDTRKMSLFHFVKRITGYDMRELKNENFKFYTPDGQELWDVVTKEFNERAKYDISYRPEDLEWEYENYRNVAVGGFDSSWHAIRAIGYKNGDLYDIGTEYGYGEGQREWQKDIINQAEQCHQEYRKQREKTLKEEESKPTPLEELYAQYGLPEEQPKNYYYGKNGKIHTNFFDNEKKIDTLNDMLDRYMQMANQMRVPAKARPHINYIL